MKRPNPQQDKFDPQLALRLKRLKSAAAKPPESEPAAAPAQLPLAEPTPLDTRRHVQHLPDDQFIEPAKEPPTFAQVLHARQQAARVELAEAMALAEKDGKPLNIRGVSDAAFDVYRSAKGLGQPSWVAQRKG